MQSLAILGGTGALGGALAKRLTAIGREVHIGSRDPAKAQAFAAELRRDHPDAQVTGSGLREAAARADIVFLTVPYAAHADTLKQVLEEVQGKVVVDATVPLRPPKVGLVQLPPAGCAAVEAAQLLGPGVKVVSALQNIGAEKLGSGGAVDGDVLVAGDESEAVETVRTILSDLGLTSWHIGPLANSAATEALTSVLIQLNRRYKLGQAGVRITGKSRSAASLQVTALAGLPLFAKDDDLASAIEIALGAAGERLQDGDVVVVAQKVVSKVEGRAVRLIDVSPGAEANDIAARSLKEPPLVELIVSESQEIMRIAPGLVISRHRTGHVLANAGIDASNVGEGSVLLWPEDPDASARRLREALQRSSGARIAVIVSDSVGRAWRMGTTGTAIGVAGMKPLRDRRGEVDLFGRELKATVVAVADEIAAAASLVIGEAAEGTPVSIVRGATYEADDETGVSELLRPLEQDLFR